MVVVGSHHEFDEMMAENYRISGEQLFSQPGNRNFVAVFDEGINPAAAGYSVQPPPYDLNPNRGIHSSNVTRSPEGN